MKITIGGRYEFDNQTDIIGRGGMGTVYRGKDTQTGNLVAIKQLKPDLLDDAFISRFMREAEVMRRLNHPHILTVYDTISNHNQGHFLVMEYIGNGSLWDELQSYPQLPIPRILTLAQNLASALMVVHEQGIIHRDIKPANVLIADDASPRLSDFGIIYQIDATRITETGGLVGTLDYLSPEVLNGEKITTQTDIWAFGVMLYEMISGNRPFTGQSVGVTVGNILTKTPTPLTTLRADAPQNLVRLVEWMLVKNPSDRVAEMNIIHQTLSDILAGTDHSTAITNIKHSLTGGKILKRIGSLPKSFTDEAFHDRDHQQADITNAILGSKSLIGVYGRGGIGKTALTCKVLGDFEGRGVVDGVVYLRADSTPPLNISTLWDKLGDFVSDDHAFHTIKHDGKVSATDKTRALLDGLTSGRYLVYIDNLETLQDSETYTLTDDDMRQLFETLLDTQGSPLTIIFTSRYPIPFPNTLKAHETIIRLDEGLPEADAIQLMRQIDSQNVLPDTDTNLKIWVEKVGGYPRGLEALVGYLNGGDTRDIDDLLEDKALFEGEVLSNIVHHAHNALPEDFRRIMAGVAIISQVTTRAELDYLLTPYISSARLRFILEKLVDSRFLSYNRQTRTYSLHPIDRDYALSSTPQGASDDDENTFSRYMLHKRMADYFLNQRKPESDWKSLDDLQPQLREMEHRYTMGDYDGTADILLEIDFNYLLKWSYYDLMLQWHVRLEGKISNPNQAIEATGNFGTAYRSIGNFNMAKEKYETALRMAREHGNRKQEGVWLGSIGINYAYLRQLPIAFNYFQQALNIAIEVQDKSAEVSWLGNIGSYYNNMGDIVQGIEYIQRALSIQYEIGNQWNACFILRNLGDSHALLGQLDVAIHHYRQALAMSRQFKDRGIEANILGNIGFVMLMNENYPEAISHLRQAVDLDVEIKQLASLKENINLLIMVYWFSGDINQALETIEQAKSYNISTMKAIEGCVLFCAERLDEAIAIFQQALEYCTGILAKLPHETPTLYIQALIFVGLWLITGDDKHFTDATEAYQHAKALAPHPGRLLINRQRLEKLLACSDKDGSALLAILQ